MAYVFSINRQVDPSSYGSTTLQYEPNGGPGDVIGVCACGGNTGKRLILGFVSDNETAPATIPASFNSKTQVSLKE